MNEGIELRLDTFSPDPLYANTLVKVNGVSGTNRYCDMLQWDERGIAVWKQQESSKAGEGKTEESRVPCRELTSRYELSWSRLEELAEAGENAEFAESGGLRISISESELKKLLRLKGCEYVPGRKREARRILNLLKRE